MRYLLLSNLLFAGGDGLYVSSNNGSNWTISLLISVYALASNGSNIFAGTDGSPYGVFKTTNYGANWTQTLLNYGGIRSLAIYDNKVLAGGYITGGGFLVSPDSGNTWINKSEGIINGVRAILIKNDYIFLGTDGGGVFRRLLSEIVSIEPITNRLPKKFKLYQNYPNPFNSSTIIKIDIHNHSTVKIIVYNSLGQEIKTLVNEYKVKGVYSVEFDGSNLASGIYIYKLITEKFIDSKKMVLIK